MAHIQNAFPGGGGGGGGSNRWFLVGGEQVTSENGWTTIGATYVDPSKGAPVCSLRLVLQASVGGFSCVARLYNADDAQAVGDVAGEITVTQNVPTYASLDLTAGTTIGFPKAGKLYYMQIKMSGGGAPQQVSCKSAYIEQL